MGKNLSANAGDSGLIRKMTWRRKGLPMLVFLPGKSRGQRSLVAYSPWGHKRVRQGLATEQQGSEHYRCECGGRWETDGVVFNFKAEWNSEEVTFKQRPLCPSPHHCCFSKINGGVTSHPVLLNFLRPTGLTSSKAVVTSVCVWLLLIKGFCFLNFTSSLYH